jgi:hypothetical protein
LRPSGCSRIRANWRCSPSRTSAPCSVDGSACRGFLDAFACFPELPEAEHHSFSGRGHPLTVQPILGLPDGYVLPVASTMIDAIRPRMEDLLQRNQKVWDRYVEHSRLVSRVRWFAVIGARTLSS